MYVPAACFFSPSHTQKQGNQQRSRCACQPKLMKAIKSKSVVFFVCLFSLFIYFLVVDSSHRWWSWSNRPPPSNYHLPTLSSVKIKAANRRPNQPKRPKPASWFGVGGGWVLLSTVETNGSTWFGSICPMTYRKAVLKNVLTLNAVQKTIVSITLSQSNDRYI